MTTLQNPHLKDEVFMTATTASELSGPVEYNFNHVSGTPGGTDSGWQTSTSYTDSGLAGSTQYCYTVQSRDSVGNTGRASATANATTNDPPPPGQMKLETGVVNGVGTSWTTVNLGSSYSSMVVVATPNYDNTSAPGSVRIQNATGSSFQIRLDAWQSPSPATNPVKGGSSHWIQYDFGHLYTLGMLHVWNHNETCCASRGLNSVTIDYSQNGTNWTTLETFTFPQAPGTGSYTGFDAADFAGVCARYVILTSNSNHGDGFAHSLSEVQFNLVP